MACCLLTLLVAPILFWGLFFSPATGIFDLERGRVGLLEAPKVPAESGVIGQEQTWENPTYKEYKDYFEDFGVSAETITTEDVDGQGTNSKPYIIKSFKGF